jgi:hypothetical protein
MNAQQPAGHGSRSRYLAESASDDALREARAYEPLSKRLCVDRISKDDLSAGMSHHQAKKLVGQYGTVGPLPKTLTDRNERMQAYKARYVATGGNKLDAWTNRAKHSDAAKTVALGAGTIAGAASLALRVPKAAAVARGASKLVARKVPKVGRITRERAVKTTDLTAGGAAVAGGANELYGDYARKRRADARSTPAGVAGSALRRMQAYTPQS